MEVFGCTQWQYLAKLQYFWTNFQKNQPKCAQKVSSGVLNQEWRSICVDMVDGYQEVSSLNLSQDILFFFLPKNVHARCQNSPKVKWFEQEN